MHVNNSLFESFYDHTKPVNNTYDGHNLISETFVRKKLRRFIFPQQDTVDPKWVVDQIAPLESLLHLMNLSWDRLSQDEMTTWDSMCQRHVSDKEISNEGLFKTSYDLRVDRNNYKRSNKIKFIDKNRQTKINTIRLILRSSGNPRTNLMKFENPNFAVFFVSIASYTYWY